MSEACFDDSAAVDSCDFLEADEGAALTFLDRSAVAVTRKFEAKLEDFRDS